MRLLLTLLAVPLGLAGCFTDAVEPAATGAEADPSVTIDEARPDPTFNDIPAADLGVLAAPDANATLDAPPVLQEGEWWRIELNDRLTGKTTQFVRVVARVEEDLVVFGMPHEGWWKEAVIFHTPAFGDVNKDLSHRAHDVPFQPLRFPLTDGATWETSWESPAPLVASVKVESPTTARVTFTGTNCGLFAFVGQCPDPTEGQVIELLYDAAQHEVVEADFPTHTWRVLEHGYGYEGWVTVPRGEDLVFLNGRVGAPVVDFTGGTLEPGLPTETVAIDGGFNRVSFILFVGGIGGPTVARERAIAPDGTEYVAEVAGVGSQLLFLENSAPDGEWQLEHVVAGGGFAFIEGIAYHQYDMLLPSGSIRSDHSHDVVR